MISLILLVLAFVCFVLASIRTVPQTISFIPIGLALLTASMLVPPLLGMRP